MMAARRELRIVSTEEVRGAVAVADDGRATFEQSAQRVFAGMRERAKDDDALAQALIEDGWSNGYLYLAAAEK